MANISGSFGHVLGGGLPVNVTMPATGAQGSPLNQLTPSAPGFNPQLVPNAPAPMPPQGMPPMAPQSPQMPQAPGMPPNTQPMADPQEKLIVAALTKQLERLDKRKEMEVLSQLNGLVAPGMPPGMAPPSPSPLPGGMA